MFRLLTCAGLGLLLLLGGCATRTLAPVVERTTAPPPPVTPVVPPPPAPVVQAEPAPPPPPPPERDWRPETYSVKRGDTLHGIALEYGLDYRELAAMNNIDNINIIRVGQLLRLRPPGDAAAAGATVTAPLSSPPPVAEARPPSQPAARPAERGNTDTYKSSPKAVKLPFSDAALAQLQATAPRVDAAAPPVASAAVAAPAPSAAPSPPAGSPGASLPAASPAVQSVVPSLANLAPPPSIAPPTPPPPPLAAPALPSTAPTENGDDKVEWSWPARGKIINGYSESASLKGIDIGGTVGLPVVATAPGRVVYAGSGLRGYGKLVIVKHNKTYLSAYAHLDQIIIREGQNVTRGQELGKMGNTDSDQVKLHFEIRQLGKPVDPLRYLPRG